MTPLRLARLALGWPQWHLARIAAVSLHKISFAERGLPAVLSLADRRRLGAALGVDPGALFPAADDGGWNPNSARALAKNPDSEVRSLPAPRL
jgi:hypothetical protein